jgi:hypothetical protein
VRPSLSLKLIAWCILSVSYSECLLEQNLTSAAVASAASSDAFQRRRLPLTTPAPTLSVEGAAVAGEIAELTLKVATDGGRAMCTGEGEATAV